MVKHIIYLSRSGEAVPSVVEVHKKLLQYREEENQIAIKNGKTGLHLLKWEFVKCS